MNRFRRFTLCAVLIPAAVGGAGMASRAYAQNGPQKEQAEKAAKQWLALVDAGKYGESYDQAAQSFRAAVSRTEWISNVSAARGPLGNVASRKLIKADEIRNPPNAPPGDYVGIQYQSSFANLKSASETVVPMLEKDGTWRVSGYFVKKAN